MPPGEQVEVTIDVDDPGLAPERTALAWTRSALSVAASGALIARACLGAHLNVLGTLIAIVMAMLAFVVWRHGRETYAETPQLEALERRRRGALAGLATVTIFTALLAIIVTLVV